MHDWSTIYFKSDVALFSIGAANVEIYNAIRFKRAAHVAFNRLV